jgi:putative PIN family toxin of toxin-antitoxin system
VRVVLDTNVIVSGVMTAHGTCARIIDMVGDGALEMYADDRILDEYDSVLHRPELRIAPESISPVLELIRHTACLIAATPLAPELPDPDDLPFLEVAAAADAPLVTGNARHYPERARQGVTVLSPAEFLEIMRHRPPS